MRSGRTAVVSAVAVLAATITVFLAVPAQGRDGGRPERRVGQAVPHRPAKAAPPAADSAPATDPDNLLSAEVSLSGTVAAILGGFVLGALLTLSSERNSMVELLRERRRTTADLRTRLAQQTAANDATLQRLLLSWLRLSYLPDDEIPGEEHIARRLDSLGAGLTGPRLAEITTAFLLSRRAADELVAANTAQLVRDSGLRTFTRWFARTVLPPNIDIDLLRDAFERAVASIERRENLASRPSPASGAADIEAAARRSESLAGAEAAVRNWHGGQEAVAATQLARELAQAESAETDLATRLASWRLPSHLGYGIALFCFIVGSGVIYPLFMMPTTPGGFSHRSDLLVKAGVGAQCAAIGLYLALLALSVRRTARSALPAS